mgnify:CR=1 FL=1
MQKEELIIKGVAIILLVFGFSRILFPHTGIFARTPTLKTENNAPVVINPFDSLDLKARAAFVWDINHGAPIFALHENVQLPIASLTKVMTALIALEEKGENATVTVSRDAVLKEGDHGFTVGETWRLKDLIDATLLTSSNDGAYALASVLAVDGKNIEIPPEYVFIKKMNEKAQQLGLHQTFFVNESGFDINFGVSGAYGSARDIARLFEYVITQHPTMVESTSRTKLTTSSLNGVMHNLENTNEFVEKLPGIISSKTGFTDLAGGNLVIAFDAGISHPVVIVVLGSTAEERFTDAEQLLFATLAYLRAL